VWSESRNHLSLCGFQCLFPSVNDCAPSSCSLEQVVEMPRCAAPKQNCSEWLEGQRSSWGSQQNVLDASKLYLLRAHIAGWDALGQERYNYLTKQCHQCRRQGLYKPCSCDGSCREGHQAGMCDLFVCRRCCELEYGDANFTACSGRVVCTVCQGKCNCCKHLWKPTPGVLAARAPEHMAL
jgi:hypothetical protein